MKFGGIINHILGGKSIIYGAGNCGRDVLTLMNTLNVQVICFLDKTPKEMYIKGIPVFRPGDEKITPKERKEDVVIIGIFNAYDEIPPIINMLKSIGYINFISFLDLHSVFPDELGDRYWLTNTKVYSSFDFINDVGSIWYDQQSRDIYNSILKFRFTGDYNILPIPELGTQYFSSTVPKWSNTMSFIDCGAFNGDTIKQLSKTEYTIESIVAFEPDPENFDKLVKFVNSNKQILEKEPILYPCGVYSKTTRLGFSSGKSDGSHISEINTELIQCVSLDDVIPNFRPTLIKMDIEGAEYEALLGAKNMIFESRPGLAICLYHKYNHLWEIPLLIKSWDIGYKFYLRSHLYNGFELVMYAIPE